MIHSMTAFGSSRVESELGSLTVEFRTVNSRYLDINIRLPDELRFVEPLVREHIARYVVRGKVDARLSYGRSAGTALNELDVTQLEHIAEQLEIARRVIPDVIAPRLLELLAAQTDRGGLELDAETWNTMCVQASVQALDQMQAARQREGQRLATMMRASAHEMHQI